MVETSRLLIIILHLLTVRPLCLSKTINHSLAHARGSVDGEHIVSYVDNTTEYTRASQFQQPQDEGISQLIPTCLPVQFYLQCGVIQETAAKARQMLLCPELLLTRIGVPPCLWTVPYHGTHPGRLPWFFYTMYHVAGQLE